MGHLASLPENQVVRYIVSGSCDVSALQVRSMPIQQPKLQTLRNTLELFEKQLEQVCLTSEMV